MWEKEKLLVTSNFSFSHSVFKRLVSQGCQKVSLCGNGLTAKVISWQSVMHMCFQSHQLLFSHASAEVGVTQVKFASTVEQNHNHQVMKPTGSPLSRPGVARIWKKYQPKSKLDRRQF